MRNMILMVGLLAAIFASLALVATEAQSTTIAIYSLDGDAVDSIAFRPVSSRWYLVVVGYAVSAVVGLGLGYIVVSWLFPWAGLPSPW